MKLFRFIQTKLAIVGFIPDSKHPFNAKILMAFSAYWLDNALNCVFIMVEVDNFIDYVNSIFIICATTAIATCYTISLIKSSQMFELIGFTEQIADHGKKQKIENTQLTAASIRLNCY